MTHQCHQCNADATAHVHFIDAWSEKPICNTHLADLLAEAKRPGNTVVPFDVLHLDTFEAVLVYDGSTAAPPPAMLVCPSCEGRGTNQATAMTFTAADLYEQYGDDFDARDGFVRDYRSGYYSEPCPGCQGQRVVDQARAAELRQQSKWAAEQAAEAASEARLGY